MAFASRLIKEEHAATRYEDPNILLYKGEGAYEAFIRGPAGSPFSGGIFNVRLRVPENYPISPPQVFFLTKIFHPNIHADSG
jgi:peroxin-4